MAIVKLSETEQSAPKDTHHHPICPTEPEDSQTFSRGRPEGSTFEGEGFSSGSQTDEEYCGSDMDSKEAYRRRRAQMKLSRANGAPVGHRGNSENPRHTHSDKHAAHVSEDDWGSEFSMSTSEELEMDPLQSDGTQSDDEETGLTKGDRKKRKRRRRRATDLDARIGGNPSASKHGQKIADRNVLRTLFMNSLLVASWYFFSLSISIYNKWMFSPKYLDFRFPLFTTCLHMLVQFCFALLVLFLIPHLRPQAENPPRPHSQPPSMKQLFFFDKAVMTRMFYFTRIAPCGAATGLDIGLGNMSLKFITLTFYTMCKSSSLAFVLTFAFVFRLETPSFKLVTIIVTMTVGVIMMVAGEVAFDILGFVLVILAAFFSGFRWSLTQILLLRSPATSNPFSSIFFLAPIMFLSLAVIAVPVEGIAPLAIGLKKLVEVKGGLLGICILFFPGLLAFLMTASEFALLQRTSVVTLSICGIFKEVVTISAAGIVFHDPLTPINISGLLITIASIAAYNYLKITKMRSEARAELEYRQKDPEIDANNTEQTAAEPMLGARDPREGRAPLLRSSDDRSRASSRVVSAKTSREND